MVFFGYRVVFWFPHLWSAGSDGRAMPADYLATPLTPASPGYTCLWQPCRAVLPGEAVGAAVIKVNAVAIVACGEPSKRDSTGKIAVFLDTLVVVPFLSDGKV